LILQNSKNIDSSKFKLKDILEKQQPEEVQSCKALSETGTKPPVTLESDNHSDRCSDQYEIEEINMEAKRLHKRYLQKKRKWMRCIGSMLIMSHVCPKVLMYLKFNFKII